MIVRRLVAGMLLACVVAGCKDGDGPNGVNYDIAIQAGDEQTGAAGSLLALPLAVVVKDPSGSPVRGAVVVYRAAAGSGVELTDTLQTTGVDGIARVEARLGGQTTASMAPIATASVRGSQRQGVTFTAKTTPGPTLTQISKTTLSAGDTVTLTGTNFNTTSTGNDVRFGSARGLITRSSETSLDVVVPPCVTPGSVPVRVVVGTASTNSLNVSYTSTAYTPALAVYQGITVSGTELGNCLRLPANGAAYLIVPQFATDADSLKPKAYVIGSTTVAAAQRTSAILDAAVSESARSAQSRFDLALRAVERAIPQGELLRDGAARREFEAEVLNSTRQFSVLSSLTASTFKTVTATLKFIGTNILVYVDQEVPAADQFTDAELTRLGQHFDRDLYPIDVAVFGAESDIDGNGKVIMLLTPVVNALIPKPACQTEGFVLGFFYGFDLTRGTGSNRGEVFYGHTPDAQGRFGCATTKADVQRRLPSTFIHELQHMISYNQHRLVRGGSQETDWLNEGLSHIAEELGARYYEAKYPPPTGRSDPNLIFPDSAQGFILEDLANAYDYLVAPSANSVTLFDTRACCEERGASWLFLRWLGDQRDSTIYTRLVQTNKTGVANVENATGETFGRLFGDFGIAAYTDSLPGVPRTSIPRQYRFTSRNLRYLFAALNRNYSNLFPRVFPIVPLSLPYDASSNQSMVPGTSAYFELTTPAGSGTVALRFAPQSGPFDAKAGAQVGIFRLR
jgi:hypothetical protein